MGAALGRKRVLRDAPLGLVRRRGGERRTTRGKILPRVTFLQFRFSIVLSFVSQCKVFSLLTFFLFCEAVRILFFRLSSLSSPACHPSFSRVFHFLFFMHSGRFIFLNTLVALRLLKGNVCFAMPVKGRGYDTVTQTKRTQTTNHPMKY